MEDWQQWQIRADEVAAELRQDVDGLDAEFFGESTGNLRAFWPRYRELKERVRVAPAIKLDDKLELERRLRGLGSKAYRTQEAAVASSNERKGELLPRIEAIRARAESTEAPRELRSVRRDLDALRKDFEADRSLVPADRQAVWDAWRDANQAVWDHLTSVWSQNETFLRDILASARQNLERGNAAAVRQDVRRLFESLKTHEARQEAVNALKAEADAIRSEAEEAEERRQAARAAAATPSVPAGNTLETWRADLERNRETLARLEQELSELERQYESADSVLEQAMVRGNLVDKRNKVSALERANRALEQRIEQTEESPPLIPTA
jgi:uncharacterized protein involved in exopolysaccharide biosynthesis